jgi:hypothetical protein
MEPGNKVPTVISSEAWDVTLAIDGAVDEILVAHGLRRKDGHSKMTETIAQLVQLAINRSYEKWQKK